MLRGVRELLGLRRSKRHNPPSSPHPTSSNPPPSPPLSTSEEDPLQHIPFSPFRQQLSEQHSPSVARINSVVSVVSASADTATARQHSVTGRIPEQTAVASTLASQKQPRVFRNRSLDYANRNTRQFLGKFSAKALRGFHRGRITPDKGRLSKDRPVDEFGVPKPRTGSENEKEHSEGGARRVRNEDSFSSLPSTHASRDPFLNDDVPIEISRLEAREDRPRWGRKDEEGAGSGGRVAGSAPGPENLPGRGSSGGLEVGSPPVSVSSNSTFRKRSSLWKRTYDPENEFQTQHERNILRAVALSEAAVKERSVPAARELGKIVGVQCAELEEVLGEVERGVENVRVVAAGLPSSRDARFESLLYPDKKGARKGAEGGMDGGRAEAERLFLELQWTERVWDVEAIVAEKRYEEGVSTVEGLKEDGIEESASPRTKARFEGVVDKLVMEMSACCTVGGGEGAGVYAPLLARVGMGEHARRVVLENAEGELMESLKIVVGGIGEVMPRMVNVLLDRTLAMFKQTHAVYSRISKGGEWNSSFFVAWVVEMADKVYAKFVAPILMKMRKADPVTILATIEAARYRRVSQETRFQRNGESMVALLETRITTHIREELDGPIRDAERQLVERARVYASAIPRNWREGPYQSGKAICDELNMLSRALEGALMNLDTDTDALVGNLLVRLALEYCTRLLEMGTKAVVEDDHLTSSAMQEGVCETFSMIGKTVLRLHQKYGKIPSLDRVANVLTSANLGEVRMLHTEIVARRAPLPSVAVTSPYLIPLVDKSSKLSRTPKCK